MTHGTSHTLSGAGIIYDADACTSSLLLCINQHTKFELPCFTNSKDMIGAKIKKRVT